MKRLLSLFLAVVMLMGFSACSFGKQQKIEKESPGIDTPAQAETTTQNHSNDAETEGMHFEGAGFSTPEEAVTAYLEAMKAGDVEEMVSTFAVESYVDHFDIVTMINQMGAYIFNVNSNDLRLDTIDNYTRSLNIGKRIGSIYNALICQYMYIANGEALERYSGMTHRIPSEDFSSGEEIVSFLMDPNWSKNLAMLDILNVENAEIKFSHKPCFDREERFIEYQESAHEKYGCQEIAEIVAEFEIGGENYYLIMELANYGGEWYNLSLCGYCASAVGLLSDDAGLILVDKFNSNDS